MIDLSCLVPLVITLVVAAGVGAARLYNAGAGDSNITPGRKALALTTILGGIISLFTLPIIIVLVLGHLLRRDMSWTIPMWSFITYFIMEEALHAQGWLHKDQISVADTLTTSRNKVVYAASLAVFWIALLWDGRQASVMVRLVSVSVGMFLSWAIIRVCATDELKAAFPFGTKKKEEVIEPDSTY